MINEASEAIAKRVIEDIKLRLEAVCAFPDSGAPRFHVRPSLRAVFRHDYVCYYLAAADEIIVVRVLHGSRDLEAVALAGGFEP
jgi:toxin ParE1/3/4